MEWNDCLITIKSFGNIPLFVKGPKRQQRELYKSTKVFRLQRFIETYIDTTAD